MFSPRLALLASLFLTPLATHANIDEETLTVRRIAAVWKRGNSAVAKQQMSDFLDLYPNSVFSDSVRVMLGDVLVEQEAYPEAYEIYAAVEREDLRQQCVEKRLEVALKMGLHDEVLDETRRALDKKEAPITALFYAKALTGKAKQTSESEEKIALFEEAKAMLQRLEDSEQQTEARLLLAELQMTLGNREQAAELYLELAKELPDRQEDLLLQVAQIFKEQSPELAVATYRQVQELAGARRAEAAFLELALLSESNQHEELLRRAKVIGTGVPVAKLPLVDYAQGRASYHLEDYKAAIAALEVFLTVGADAEVDKQAYLMLMQSANKEGNLVVFETQLDRFAKLYPEDPQLLKAQLLFAGALETAGELERAALLLETLELASTDSELLPQVSFQRLRLALKEMSPLEQYAQYRSFVETYPKHPSLAEVLPQMVQLALNEAQSGEQVDKERVLEALQLALKLTHRRDAIYPRYILLLGQTQRELGDAAAAVAVLENLLQNYPTFEELHQAYFTIALASYEAAEDLNAFTTYGEKALELQSRFEGHEALRQNLAAAYIQLAREGNEAELLDRAAEQLHILLAVDSDVLVPANLVWLANHGFSSVGDLLRPYVAPTHLTAEQLHTAQRTLAVHEVLWKKLEETTPYPLELEDNIYLEQGLLQRATLLGALGHFTEQQELLTILRNAQLLHPQWAWLSQGGTTFALAQLHERGGQIAQAQTLYQDLADRSLPIDSVSWSQARLKALRLAYQLLPDEQRVLQDPEAHAILDKLHELAMQKVVEQEPVHLEAALDYARLSGRMAPEGFNESGMLGALRVMKHSFTATDEVWARSYQEALQEYPDVAALYQSYMTLIDAEIAYLEARTDMDRQVSIESDHRRQGAERLLKALLSDAKEHSTALAERVQENLRLIEASAPLTEAVR